MTGAEICQAIQVRFGGAVLLAQPEGLHPFVKVAAASWRDVAAFARADLGCETLHDLTAVDSKDRKTLEVQVRLWSYSQRHWVNLKADVDREKPVIASLDPLWKAADWHERECYDMFGVVFEGHPNLARILCPEDWVGWPLRKDYEMPDWYHGIPGIALLRGKEAEQGRVFPKPKAPPPPKPVAAAAPAAAAPPAAPKPAAPPPAAAKPPAPPAPPPPPAPPEGGAA